MTRVIFFDTLRVKVSLELILFSQSEAVFDENCNVFLTTGDGLAHKLVPLPISDVVPVLDCIDEFNVAYFSYKNNEQSVLRIPYVADRNALSPGVSQCGISRACNSLLHTELGSNHLLQQGIRGPLSVW